MAKILLHTLVFPPDGNSNAYIFGDLALELKNLGHELVVLTTTPHYNLDEEALRAQPMRPERGDWLLKSDYYGIPCYHIKVPQVKGSIATRMKTAILFHGLGFYAALGKEFSCDVVLSQSPPLSIGLVSAWIAKKHRAKAVYLVQDIFPDGLIDQGKIKNPLLIRFLRLLERKVYKSSDAVTSISDGLVEILRKRVPATTLLRTIPNFVNTELYRPLPRHSDFSKEHGLDDRFVASYVGNMGNAQNFAPVMAAAKALKGLPFKFILAGGGIKQEALAREAREKNLENLEVWGYQPREVTPVINASSDLCLVLLSSHVKNFSFPSKIYTIMACGRPILLYGHPEADVSRFVQESKIGWVVPDGDVEGFCETLKRLSGDRQTLDEYGRRALALAKERFTAKAVAHSYDDLFATLTGTGRKTA
ncbi:glycosyltransferase WbuB [bacterium]|nr:MAG: glycosyltransferase WbuB [bacterium]